MVDNEPQTPLEDGHATRTIGTHPVGLDVRFDGLRRRSDAITRRRIWCLAARRSGDGRPGGHGRSCCASRSWW
jgi:hypothetical protein